MSGNKLGIVVLILVGLILLIGATNQNQGGASFALSWQTVDGGGQMASEGGRYILSGTIGQPDTEVLSGGGYALGGGFWPGGVLANYGMYLPILIHITNY
jgi:hypothetical protein